MQIQMVDGGEKWCTMFLVLEIVNLEGCSDIGLFVLFV